jgi:ubiquinone/menaquinone biosynthesis C-methylase UbiE
VDRYRRLVGRRYLEVGPGSGYFLDAAGVDGGTDVTLLDPNPNVLAKTSRRLRHLAPATVEAEGPRRWMRTETAWARLRHVAVSLR